MAFGIYKRNSNTGNFVSIEELINNPVEAVIKNPAYLRRLFDNENTELLSQKEKEDIACSALKKTVKAYDVIPTEVFKTNKKIRSIAVKRVFAGDTRDLNFHKLSTYQIPIDFDIVVKCLKRKYKHFMYADIKEWTFENQTIFEMLDKQDTNMLKKFVKVSMEERYKNPFFSLLTHFFNTTVHPLFFILDVMDVEQLLEYKSHIKYCLTEYWKRDIDSIRIYFKNNVFTENTKKVDFKKKLNFISFFILTSISFLKEYISTNERIYKSLFTVPSYFLSVACKHLNPYLTPALKKTIHENMIMIKNKINEKELRTLINISGFTYEDKNMLFSFYDMDFNDESNQIQNIIELDGKDNMETMVEIFVSSIKNSEGLEDIENIIIDKLQNGRFVFTNFFKLVDQIMNIQNLIFPYNIKHNEVFESLYFLTKGKPIIQLNTQNQMNQFITILLNDNNEDGINEMLIRCDQMFESENINLTDIFNEHRERLENMNTFALFYRGIKLMPTIPEWFIDTLIVNPDGLEMAASERIKYLTIDFYKKILEKNMEIFYNILNLIINRQKYLPWDTKFIEFCNFILSLEYKQLVKYIKNYKEFFIFLNWPFYNFYGNRDMEIVSEIFEKMENKEHYFKCMFNLMKNILTSFQDSKNESYRLSGFSVAVLDTILINEKKIAEIIGEKEIEKIGRQIYKIILCLAVDGKVDFNSYTFGGTFSKGFFRYYSKRLNAEMRIANFYDGMKKLTIRV